MSPILLLLLFLGASNGIPIDTDFNENAALLLKDENENGSSLDDVRVLKEEDGSSNYNFGFSIVDGINDASIERTETRENNRVTGAYSYTDGYIKQTVVYVADEFGFRVTDINTEEIGQGPIKNESGTAIVQSYIDGVETNYAIQAEAGEPQSSSSGSHSGGRVIFSE